MNKETKERIERVQNLRKEYEKTIRKEFGAVLRGLTTELFGDFPEVKGIVWTQYTPHFNDGDPCEFGINEPHVMLDQQFADACGDNVYDYDGETFDLSTYKIRKKDGKSDVELKLLAIEEKLNEFERFLNEFSMVVEETYGDGVKVTVTPNGVSVDDYSHD